MQAKSIGNGHCTVPPDLGFTGGMFLITFNIEVKNCDAFAHVPFPFPLNVDTISLGFCIFILFQIASRKRITSLYV